jgi:purine-binding chemotaxis protein CheW
MSAVCVRVLAGGEHYAIPVASVLEVAEYGEVTAVPGASSVVLGVRNLRGQVLPVIELATALGLQDSADHQRILIVENDGHLAGLAVNEVVDVGVLGEVTEDVESPSLRGALLVDGALVGVVDVGAVLGAIAPASKRIAATAEPA